ncbi:hypothetical protein [Legionella sp. PC997]|uniref:hypothetical protein n=1 Tax=Legionella sp. PC997 TaxID=2755562 RepID=UPI0018606AB6|nr:hypothetical protein [Legionella sp. PC997]QMT58701.1 hypothetical protein HBNCFIEN_00054 [Legionella sp. PC997]
MAGFFSNRAYVHQEAKPRAEYNFINVGNEQFHAVAVAMIDSLQSVSQRGNDATLKKILERFYLHFPKYINNQPYLTLPERMSMLLNTSRKSELVDCMAYVLRQLAVDEIYTNPLMYREVFNGLSADTPKSYLRNPEVELPSSALKALAQALEISITLSFKELGKELRKREVYEGETGSNKINLVIQVQGDQHFPAVKHKADFAYVGQLAINAPKPIEHTKEQGETLSDIIGLIAEDNKQLLQSYEQWRKTILSMVVAGELNRKQLVRLYITFLPAQMNNTISSALEHANRKPVIAGIPQEREQQMIELLANALSSWISTKQVEPDSLFDQIENQSAISLR